MILLEMVSIIKTRATDYLDVIARLLSEPSMIDKRGLYSSPSLASLADNNAYSRMSTRHPFILLATTESENDPGNTGNRSLHFSLQTLRIDYDLDSC